MDYITVRKAAEKGKASECTETECQVTITESEDKQPNSCLLPLMNTSFQPGHCREYLEHMAESPQKEMAMAEYYYFSGQPEKAAKATESILQNYQGDLKISATLISAYANLSLGEMEKVRSALKTLNQGMMDADEYGQQSDGAKIFAAVAAGVLFHLPVSVGIPETKEYPSGLPMGLRSFAMYVRAHYRYLQGEYRESLGIAETALLMGGRNYPIPSVYLHMVAVMDYMSIRKPGKAKEHLLAAWEIARQDQLLQIFGEHHGLLGGMLESVIKKDWPEEFRKIIAITYRFSEGWRQIHNPHTGHQVADNLTTTEFAVAMLAARGWTNQEISQQMNISSNTVKSHISSVFQKLHIRQRQELKKFMLW